MAIDKGVWTWAGFSGAPGYSVFYATPGMGISGVIDNFFQSIESILPSSVTVTGPTGGDTLDETSGNLVGSWSGGAGLQAVGTQVSSGPAPAGISITWLTNGIARGRRVRGRTFLVPVGIGMFEGDGSLTNAALSTVRTAADALVAAAAGDLLVWSRPRLGSGGTVHPITGARVSDRVAVLRSRRD